MPWASNPADSFSIQFRHWGIGARTPRQGSDLGQRQTTDGGPRRLSKPWRARPTRTQHVLHSRPRAEGDSVGRGWGTGYFEKSSPPPQAGEIGNFAKIQIKTCRYFCINIFAELLFILLYLANNWYNYNNYYTTECNRKNIFHVYC